MKIFIFTGHVLNDSTSAKLANEYEKGALEAGYEVKRMNLWDMRFDPILHDDYRSPQELEPDLQEFQKNLKWADHLVFIYPNWWSAMPAGMKGVFDRTILPGFAFKFLEDGSLLKLLKGKTARVISTTSGLHPLLFRAIVGDYTNEIKKGILRFCGVEKVRFASFGPTIKASEERKKSWERKVKKWGSKAI